MRAFAMGMDLMLLPLQGPDDLRRRAVIPFTALELSRDYRVTGQLTDFIEDAETRLHPREIPEDAKVYLNRIPVRDEPEPRTANKYGETLTYLLTGEFRQLELPEDASYIDRAAMAYLAALPEDIPVILFWH